MKAEDPQTLRRTQCKDFYPTATIAGGPSRTPPPLPGVAPSFLCRLLAANFATGRACGWRVYCPSFVPSSVLRARARTVHPVRKPTPSLSHLLTAVAWITTENRAPVFFGSRRLPAIVGTARRECAEKCGAPPRRRAVLREAACPCCGNLSSTTLLKGWGSSARRQRWSTRIASKARPSRPKAR